MSDPFQKHARGLTAPADRHFAIIPSDSTDLPIRPRVLCCTTAGTVAIRDMQGLDVTYPLEAGQVLLFSPVRVLASGTTATVVGWL
ncbi:spike base protein, RCAP_Rcc01079 family [Pseudogemmobacter bohemicus]|uniref:spike base protein, RCAP_Rcc01079 family n=1 Tax=Pseudogemmobacter bohemicus TaxID=2250708 RepID=UPI000DD36292|nr:hypothetical protein [Pseudogemmobacter bohemicus]